MSVVGVDPATDIAEMATENGVETVADFFGYDLAVNLRKNMVRLNILHLIMHVPILMVCLMW